MNAAVLGEELRGPAGWGRHITVPGHPANPVIAGVWFLWLPQQGVGGYDCFLLQVASLRQVDDIPVPEREYPEATHQLLLTGLAPDRRPVPEFPATWGSMDPNNVQLQFEVDTDGQAAAVARTLAVECVRGRLPAETQVLDGGQLWFDPTLVQRWRKTLAVTAMLERDGGTPGV